MTLKRRSLLLTSFALLASPARASLSPADLALLDGETIPYHCEQVADAVSRVAWLFEYLKDTARAPIARHVAAIAARTFQPARTLVAIQARLATLPPPACTEELVAAFNRYADAMDNDFPVHFGFREDIADVQENYKNAMLARPDHAAIAALTALTPNVAIGEETMLASGRLHKAVYVLAGLNPSTFRAHPRTEWNAVIDPVCAAPRPSVPESMAEGDMPTGINAAQVRASLSTLPAADIALLLAFYTSREGQARRAAITEITQAQMDHDTRTTILTYLEERYTQPEPIGGWYPTAQFSIMRRSDANDAAAITPASRPKVVTVSSTPRSSPSRKPGLDRN